MSTASFILDAPRLGSRRGRRRLPARMSEEEFAALPSDVRAEWVDGKVIVMAPVSIMHGRLNVWLTRLLGEFVERHRLGEIFGPEVAARLASQRSRRVPDLMFIAKARLGLLAAAHVEGPPDLIVEIVSPESVVRDWRDKRREYERAGVREYWVIDPAAKRFEAYAASAGGAYARLPEEDGKVHSSVLAGLFIRPAWLWAPALPNVHECLEEIEAGLRPSCRRVRRKNGKGSR